VAGERRSYIVFGKIHISPWVDFRTNLIEFLNTDKRVISKRGAYEYCFGDIQEFTIDRHKLIFGRLGKVSRRKEVIIDDRESRRFITKPLDFSMAEEYSNFVIDIENKQIVFEDRMGRLPAREFRYAFSRLYKEVHKDLSDLQILMISEVEEILKEIRKYELISKG